MESEDIEPTVSSRAHATAAPIRPFITGGGEKLNRRGQKANDSLLWPVFLCVLF